MKFSDIKPITTLGSSFILLAILLLQQPILLKWMLGTARIIGPPIQCEILIDNKKHTEARLFHSATNFTETEPRDYYILFLPDASKSNPRRVLVIDVTSGKIKLPNSGAADYVIIFGYLFQSDSGANIMIPLSDGVKGDAFDPKLTIDTDAFTFLMRNRPTNDKQTIRINFPTNA